MSELVRVRKSRGRRTGAACGMEVAAIGCWLLLTSGCGPVEIADERRALLEGWGRLSLLPTYEELGLLTAALEERSRAFCDAPDAPSLLDVQEAFWVARGPLGRSAVFAFGPYTDEPLRLGAKLDFWPARTDAIDAFLADEETISVRGVAALPATLRGLPVIEYLLYALGSDALQAFMVDPRRCAYLVALAGDAHRSAELLWESWHPDHDDYLAELTQAGRGSSSFENLQLAVGAVVNRMAFVAEGIRRNELGRPLGDEVRGSPSLDAVRSRFSGRSLEDVRDELRGLDELYFGVDGEHPEAALASFMERRGKELRGRFRRRLRECQAAIDAIHQPLTEAIVERPEGVRRAVGALVELEQFIQVDLMGALSLSVVFSDNDGD